MFLEIARSPFVRESHCLSTFEIVFCHIGETVCFVLCLIQDGHVHLFRDVVELNCRHITLFEVFCVN